MMTFKNRIAFYYMIATAIIIAVVFAVVYVIVNGTVYRNLDNDLSYEAQKHTSEIEFHGDSLYFINKAEWAEREHRQAQVNPVFIQVLDKDGHLMDKSPNLREQELPFSKNLFNDHFDTELNGRAIRQVQLPITQNGKTSGYILAAVSLESSKAVLKDLRTVLLISFPIVLLGLFFISRFLAGRSIIPVKRITNTSKRITQTNLEERVPLPAHHDELFDLASSINDLLQRISNALQRERQFTSDASHELRTPLSALRGTLEILIRKPRTTEEYQDKIKYSLSEIDRMATIIEQLLLLARFDDNGKNNTHGQVSLVSLIDTILTRYQREIDTRRLTIRFKTETEEAEVPQYYSNLILDNIINNAIKYARENTEIEISVSQTSESILCQVSDHGIGIRQEDVKNLFHPFFRSDALNHKHISGTGLGLSIAHKAADAIGAQLSVASQLGEGTMLTIKFPLVSP